jgi:putative ABC transport system ATP-binding protein
MKPTEQMAGVAVSTDQLTKIFGTGPIKVTALGGVDLEVSAGEVIAVMGPSGSGKSTLLHLIGAMDVPTSGTLTVGTVDVGRLRGAAAASYRRNLGFVFQSYHLLSALSALDNVLAPVLPFGNVARREADAIAILDAVGLGDRLTAVPSELSGGQQQRVAIARALVNDPFLLLADEPTGNLDSATGNEVIELIISLHSLRRTTLILATHDHEVAKRCDRIVRLIDGRIV